MLDPFDEMFAETHKGNKASWEDDFDEEDDVDEVEYDDYSDGNDE